MNAIDLVEDPPALDTLDLDSNEYIEAQVEQIALLKGDKNAVILVHNYQREEIQDIADFRGDSLELARAAAATDASIIVFCGVYFMAESAAILSPDKTVLLPVREAGCPMADMINVGKLRKLKEQYPGAEVVCYVNSSADVKAESDICCTSSNAITVVNNLDADQIIFVPDRHLGHWAQQHTNKEIILYTGFCPTHCRLTTEEVEETKTRYPHAEFIAHPECSLDVLEMADHVCSTSGMFRYAGESDADEFIIGTEKGLLYNLRTDFPDKEFHLASDHLVCANMKLTTLGWVIDALKHEQHVVSVSPEVRERARLALDRMLEVA